MYEATVPELWNWLASASWSEEAPLRVTRPFNGTGGHPHCEPACNTDTNYWAFLSQTQNMFFVFNYRFSAYRKQLETNCRALENSSELNPLRGTQQALITCHPHSGDNLLRRTQLQAILTVGRWSRYAPPMKRSLRNEKTSPNIGHRLRKTI